MASQLLCAILFAFVFILIGYHESGADAIGRKLGGKKINKIEKKKGEKTKSVSSDKVHNGGRKGPMSGGSQGVPMPLAIPFPIIPLQGNGGKSAQKSKNKKKKTQEAESDKSNKGYSIKDVDRDLTLSKGKAKSRKNGKIYTKTIMTSPNDMFQRSKRSVDDEVDEQSDDDKTEFKRSADEDYEDELNEEERDIRRDWLIDGDDEGYLPGTENVYFNPSELDFIWQGDSVLSRAYQAIMPSMRLLTKRSTDEESEDENKAPDDLMKLNKNAESDRDMAKRDLSEVDKEVDEGEEDLMKVNSENTDRGMQTREVSIADEEEDDSEEELDIVNEDKDFQDGESEEERDTRETAPGDEPPSSIEEAERQLKNAELAAEALTHLEMQVGIDPEHLVSNTHKYVMSLQAEKAKYDTDIRSHINKAREAEKRASVPVHDEVKKSEISGDVAAAKKQLESDRSKIEEINTQLKQLKDIELMATGLEVAKYLAKERAQHNLVLAKENAAKTQVPIAVQPVQQMQQPQMEVTQQQPSVDANSFSMQQSQSGETVGTWGYPSGQSQSVVPAAQPVVAVQPQIAAYQPPIAPVPMYSALQPTTPMLQQHQMGEQRNEESRPSFNTPAIKAPLTQYLSSYIQSQKNSANQFAAQPHWLTAASRPFSQPRPMFHQPPPPVYHEEHVEGDQRHSTAKTPSDSHSLFMLRPPQSATANVNLMTSFARPLTQKSIGLADHEITKIEQPHKIPNTNDEHKDSEENHDDSAGGMLSFPGTTYSPPPSWLQRPNDNRAQAARIPSQGASRPYLPPNGFHPSITEISNHPAYHPNIGVAPLSTLHPYEPSAEPVTGPIPYHQFSQQSSLSAPSMASYTSQPAPVELVAPVQNIAPVAFNSHQNFQNTLFNEKEAVEMRPGTPLNYAAPQNQQAQVGEVIKTNPQDEVVTVNQKPEPEPTPPPPPDMSGNLPGWMGAVDSAKYGNDVSDRLRETNGSKPASTLPSDSDDQNVKREYLHLQKAQAKLQDTFKAASAVTHIESSVGFDPGSIAKMVDFVKTAAIKDVKLSKETVDKDKETLKKVEENSISKKSEIAKKSEVDSVAFEHAKQKLKSDEAVLADAEDRLDKIQKMELIVTEIEVAKYYAANKAENEVQGAKRTLDSLKRNEVQKPEK